MGGIQLKTLVTKVAPFEKVVEAWETAKRGEGIKTLIRGVGYTDGFDLGTSESA